jgi:hypothetical protein
MIDERAVARFRRREAVGFIGSTGRSTDPGGDISL